MTRKVPDCVWTRSRSALCPLEIAAFFLAAFADGVAPEKSKKVLKVQVASNGQVPFPPTDVVQHVRVRGVRRKMKPKTIVRRTPREESSGEPPDKPFERERLSEFVNQASEAGRADHQRRTRAGAPWIDLEGAGSPQNRTGRLAVHVVGVQDRLLLLSKIESVVAKSVRSGFHVDVFISVVRSGGYDGTSFAPEAGEIKNAEGTTTTTENMDTLVRDSVRQGGGSLVHFSLLEHAYDVMSFFSDADRERLRGRITQYSPFDETNRFLSEVGQNVLRRLNAMEVLMNVTLRTEDEVGAPYDFVLVTRDDDYWLGPLDLWHFATQTESSRRLYTKNCLDYEGINEKTFLFGRWAASQILASVFRDFGLADQRLDTVSIEMYFKALLALKGVESAPVDFRWLPTASSVYVLQEETKEVFRCEKRLHLCNDLPEGPPFELPHVCPDLSSEGNSLCVVRSFAQEGLFGEGAGRGQGPREAEEGDRIAGLQIASPEKRAGAVLPAAPGVAPLETFQMELRMVGRSCASPPRRASQSSDSVSQIPLGMLANVRNWTSVDVVGALVRPLWGALRRDGLDANVVLEVDSGAWWAVSLLLLLGTLVVLWNSAGKLPEAPVAAREEGAEDSTTSTSSTNLCRLLPVMLAWIGISAGLIFFNKMLFSPLAEGGYDFPHVGFLMLWHMLCAIFFTTLIRLSPAGKELMPEVADGSVTARQLCCGVAPVGVALAASLYLGNAAYIYLSVSYMQMLKSCTALVVHLVTVAVGQERFHQDTAKSITLICLGTVLASVSEMGFSTFGFALQFFGMLADAFRVVLLTALVSSKGTNLSPLGGLHYYAPAGFLALLPPFLLHDLPQLPWARAWDLRAPLVANGMVAFALHLSVLAFLKQAGGTTLSIVGVFKDILLCVATSAYFAHPVTSTQAVGYAISIWGLREFNQAKAAKQKQQQHEQQQQQQRGLSAAAAEQAQAKPSCATAISKAPGQQG